MIMILLLVAWYVVGVVSLLYIVVKNGDVHLYDLIGALIMGCMGPIMPLIFILYTYSGKVLIKSRKIRNKK